MANIKKLIFVCLAAVVIASSSGQKVLRGRCSDNVDGVIDFDVSKFLGRWYEVAKSVSEYGSKCNSAQYEQINENTIKIIESQIKKATGEKTLAQAVGNIVGPGELNVQQKATLALLENSKLAVASTDYDNYAVVYNCNDLPFNSKAIVILARQRLPDLKVIKQARQAIADLGLSPEELIPTDQIDCPE